MLYDNADQNQSSNQQQQIESRINDDTTELSNREMVKENERSLDTNNVTSLCSELVDRIEQTNDDETTIPGIEQLNGLQTKLLGIVRINFNNKSALLKKATFALLEYIASTNMNQIENLLMSRVYIQTTFQVSVIKSNYFFFLGIY